MSNVPENRTLANTREEHVADHNELARLHNLLDNGDLSSVVVRKFPFAFDTPNLLTGHTVYTPTIGDVLLDAWIEIDQLWDGTTPRLDIGTFVGSATGLFSFVSSAIKLGATGGGIFEEDAGAGIAFGNTSSNGFAYQLSVLSTTGSQTVPSKFTEANPIKIVVSQDGTNIGADPGSAQGSAILYLVTATPLDGPVSVPGVPTYRKFPFAYNTPNLLTGAAVYTPTIGDILLNAWIQIDTAWNGTTPKGDIGTFTGDVEFTQGGGLFGLLDGGPLLMTSVDVAEYDPGYLSPDVGGTRNPALVQGIARIAPGKIMTADPIKVCVSQDGTNIGADPGSSQGSAVLYLVTVTPV